MNVHLIITKVNPVELNSSKPGSLLLCEEITLPQEDVEKYLISKMGGFEQTHSSGCGKPASDPTFVAILVNGDQIATIICIPAI